MSTDTPANRLWYRGASQLGRRSSPVMCRLGVCLAGPPGGWCGVRRRPTPCTTLSWRYGVVLSDTCPVSPFPEGRCPAGRILSVTLAKATGPHLTSMPGLCPARHRARPRCMLNDQSQRQCLVLSAAGGANVSFFFLRECFTAAFRGVGDLVTALQLSHPTVLPPNGCGEGAAPED